VPVWTYLVHPWRVGFWAVKRGFSSRRGRGVSLLRWICHRRRFRWCAGAHGGEVGGRFLVGALAHASRVGAVVASGGVRLPGFPRVAEAKRKAADKGERVWGPGHTFGVGIVSAPQTALPHLVEPLEPPPACPFAGRSAQGSSACHHPRSSHEASGAPRMARR
jgi:hypothetical protein